jgi:tetratricopeptide (TPR) repeat protein
MNRISFLILIAVMTISSAFAQSVKVQSTVNYLKNRLLDKAKEAIDDASVHEKTINDPKTWYYKGTVYLELHLINSMTNGIAVGQTPAEIKNRFREPLFTKNVNVDGNKAVRWEYADQMYIYFKDDKVIKWDEPAGGKFKNLAENPLAIAYDCFQKSISLDEGKDYYELNMIQLFVCGEQFYNQGAVFFNDRKFANALSAFEKTIKINEIFQRQDSIASYYAAQSALLSNDTVNAIKYFKALVSLKYKEPKVYTNLSEIYLKQKDTVKAIKTLETAKNILPNEYSIVVAEANIYISKGEMDKAQELLEIAIQKNPNNHVIHYIIGTNYSNKLDELKYEDDTAFYVKIYETAEKYFKSCLNIKPDMAEANFNLGVLYFNEGVRILTIANNITDPSKIEATEKLFKDKWNQAAPYLEKALEMQPDDIATLQTLKNLYARTNQLDKSKEMDNKIKLLQK